MPKIPAWQLLIAQGFCPDRKQAESLVLTGKVYALDKRVATAGALFAPDAELRVKGFDLKYVNKGGLKLSGALDDFHMNIEGRVCIDAGASKGGFTDCLIQRGAARVYAVDAGFGELAGSLRQHDRVVNLERTNISDASLLTLSPAPTLGTVDLSYLSLVRAIPIFAEILHGTGVLICLVKPIYEVEDAGARRTGDINHAGFFRDILTRLAAFVREKGYAPLGITHSHVTGNKGTVEFFIALSLDGGAEGLSPADVPEAVERAIERGMALTQYKKPT